MKIFFLTARVPYPIDKGDKLRAFYQIKHLSEKHDVFLFAIDEDINFNPQDNPLMRLCAGIEVVPLPKQKIALNLISKLFSKLPFQVAFYYNQRIKKRINKAIKSFKPDVIFCQLIRPAEYLSEITNIPKIIDYVDIISKGIERRISKSNLFFKWLLNIEYKRVIEYEKSVFENFNKHIIISYEDRNYLPFEGREKVKVIPNGIDLNFFTHIEAEKTYDLFFSGNLSYPPNIDASFFIAKKILPKLLAQKNDVKVLIAGASPSRKVLSLSSDYITIKGWTDDVRDYYKSAKLFIAPMQIGTGLQNKILQALAMKIPCVASELTIKGLADGADEVIMVAKTPEDYVELIVKLLNDDKLCKDIAEKGYEYVKAYYDWENIANQFNEILMNISFEK
ncbi:glycosyl transferase group 1 [Melioribacter roseus P3M-2]|uniref:Glycosyl transferase group 1 n=1 Tax=Melioribacter roseus (strain DSM 23840 / JCM 17771 / VKM B-2668 / P3M-2) TaxID=1191523 RepID=I6ZWV6_MELRP|nr:glycosyltransferase [Melioribacter roseus]AFN73543.1 glycosyl transferase group 1 [Melioribacter roseus P3M-2]